jgi:hypothetical protein
MEIFSPQSIHDIKLIKRTLASGQIFPYNKDITFAGDLLFSHVQKLFYSYLSLLDEICSLSKTGRLNYRLDRDRNGNPRTRLDHKNDSNLLFDIRGGTFVCNPEIRRLYLKYRFAFVMSLWDLAQRNKCHYFRQKSSAIKQTQREAAHVSKVKKKSKIQSTT